MNKQGKISGSRFLCAAARPVTCKDKLKRENYQRLTFYYNRFIINFFLLPRKGLEKPKAKWLTDQTEEVKKQRV